MARGVWQGLALAAIIAVAAYGDTSVALTNPGMEPPYAAVNADGSGISGNIAAGWQDNSGWANAAVQYSEETNNPHSGSACQKIVVTGVGSGRAQFLQPFQLQAGSIYTASVWLRGDAGLEVSLVIQQGVSPYATYLQSSVELSANWQQVIATGYITTNETAYLMVAIDAPGTLWADDFGLSFTPGTFAPTPRIGPIASSFFGMHVENFLQSQLLNSGLEPPYVSAGVNNPISGSIAVNWNDNSSWGVPNPTVTYSEDTVNPHSGTAAQKVAVASVPANTAVQLVQPLTVIPGQVYKFSAWMRGDQGLQIDMVLQDSNSPYTYYAETTAKLSAAWQQFTAQGMVSDTGSILLMFHATQPGTFWVDDVQFTDSTGTPVSGGVPWPPTKFGTLRLWDTGTSWTSLEPVQGVWNWQPLDLWVAAAEQHGVKDILLTLGQTPAWASSNPDEVNYIGAGAPAPPTDNQNWRDYITAVAERYKGRIRYYEIWNEPNIPTYYTGTVAELAELTAEAYAILKSADPGNTVLSAAPSAAPGYLEQMLQAGIAQNVDMIAYHFYETPPEAAAADLANVSLVMAANGVGSMPVWATEGAAGDDTTQPEALAAAYLVRKYLVHLAFGSVRFNWYAWGKATTFCVGTEENDPRVLTEAGRAFGILLGWLKGASLTGASIDDSGTWRIDLTLADDSRGIIVWNPNNAVPFQIPEDLRMVIQRDILGNRVAVAGSIEAGYSPVLLVSPHIRR